MPVADRLVGMAVPPLDAAFVFFVRPLVDPVVEAFDVVGELVTDPALKLSVLRLGHARPAKFPIADDRLRHVVVRLVVRGLTPISLFFFPCIWVLLWVWVYVGPYLDVVWDPTLGNVGPYRRVYRTLL